MQRVLLNAALLLVLAFPGWAQMRGGHVAAPSGRFGSRTFVVVNGGPAFGSHWRSEIVIRTFPRSFFPHQFHRRFFPYYPAWYAYTPYWYGGYYPSWDSYSLSYESANNAAETRQLYSEINRLSNEVENLRQQQEARAYRPQPPSPPPPAAAPQPPRDLPPAEPSTLIFRDHHSERVQNYAVVGQTLWILDEKRGRKVPIADVDIPATQKANEDEGIEFRVPTAPQ